MSEGKLNENSSCFLIKDERVKEKWDSNPIYQFLKEEGFQYAKGYKSIEGIDWLYVNIYSKVFAKGRPCIAYAPVVGDHAITFDEFLTIYNIYKKYEGLGTLKMTNEEQDKQNKKSAEERLEKIREAMREHYRLIETDEEYRKRSEEIQKIIDEYVTHWEDTDDYDLS